MNRSQAGFDVLIRALQAARDDGTGIVLDKVPREAIPYLIASLAVGRERAQLARGEHSRRLIRLTERADG